MGVFSIIRPTSSLLVLAALILPLTEVSAAIIGKESARIVSNDPNSLEAQISEASGDAVFCKGHPGTLNLIKQDNKVYLIGTAHGFYNDGKLRDSYVKKNGDIESCDNSYGTFYPDFHYGDKNLYKINHKKAYRFSMPPLNHADALKYTVSLQDIRNVNDFVILEILDKSVLMRQLLDKNGNMQMRKTIELLDANHKIIKDYAAVNAFINSSRTNFYNFEKVSHEENCQISDFYKNGVLTKLKKHTCDTGKNSSGASLNVFHEDQIYSLGIHYGGRIGRSIAPLNEALDQHSPNGNFFIPPQEMIEAIKKFAQ